MDDAQRDAQVNPIRAVHRRRLDLTEPDNAILRGRWATLKNFNKQGDDDVTDEKK